jgi:thymidylate synthase
MNLHDQTYMELLRSVLEFGELVPNRTGTDSISRIGAQVEYDLKFGFPIFTSKKVVYEMAFAEMLWFISGNCHRVETLESYKVGAEKLWTPWARNAGPLNDYLGPIYGEQWRRWAEDENGNRIDQLQTVVDQIKSGSTSRRLIVTAWQPNDIADMALPPCHMLFQFTVRSGKLHLQLYQRSCDLPIGGPFNVAQYALLLAMVAKLAKLEPGRLIHSIHDAHIYVNQIEGVEKWLDRSKGGCPESPKLVIHGDQQNIDDFKLSDFEVVNYESNGYIKFPVAV